MYPKLRTHVFRIELPEGIFFRGMTGAFLLRGEGLGPWVEYLTSQMDGTHSWREIVGDLPRAHRAVLKRMLKALLEHGFAYNAANDEPHQLTAQERERYRHVIQYLGEFSHRAERRFERLRRSPVLAVGSGLCLSALLRSLLQLGTECIDFIDLTDSPDLREHLLQPYRHLPTTLTPIAGAQMRTAVTAKSYAVVLYAGSLDSPLLPELATECAAAETLLIAGGVGATGALLWPAFHKVGAACWDCLNARLRSHGLQLAEDESSPALLTLTGSRLSYEWLLWQTRIKPPPTLDSFVLLDPVTLAEEVHRYLPRPTCSRCANRLRSAELLALEALVDRVGGYLHALGPFALEQLPLAQCAAYLPPALGRGHERIVRAGLDLDEAKERALRAGLERFLTIEQGLDAERVVVALGRSRAEWVGRATLGAAERLVRNEALRGEWSPSPLLLGPNADTASHRHYKALRIWYQLPVSLYGAYTPWGAAAGVACRGEWLALKTGVTLAHAVYEALLFALHAQSQGAPERIVCQIAIQQEPQQLNEPGGAHPDWQRWFDAFGYRVSATSLALVWPLAPTLLGGWVDFTALT